MSDTARVLDDIDAALGDYVEWHGSDDAAEWSSDGSHEYDTDGDYYASALGDYDPWAPFLYPEDSLLANVVRVQREFSEVWVSLMREAFGRQFDRSVMWGMSAPRSGLAATHYLVDESGIHSPGYPGAIHDLQLSTERRQGTATPWVSTMELERIMRATAAQESPAQVISAPARRAGVAAQHSPYGARP